MASSAEFFFAALTKLIDALVLNQQIVETALGVTLDYDATHTNSAFVFYRHDRSHQKPAPGFLGQVDLRIPYDPAKAEKGLLHVDLEPTPGLTASSIMAKYGQPLEVQIPTPQESLGTGTAVRYAYALDHWQIWFSFSPPPTESLIAFSMTYRNAKPKSR